MLTRATAKTYIWHVVTFVLLVAYAITKKGLEVHVDPAAASRGPILAFSWRVGLGTLSMPCAMQRIRVRGNSGRVVGVWRSGSSRLNRWLEELSGLRNV